MGNSICFEASEFYLRFAYITDKKGSDLHEISKFIQWNNFNNLSLQPHLGKVLFKDIQDHLLQDEQQLSSIKKFAEEEFVKGNDDAVLDINITGDAFDDHKEEISTLLSKLLKKYVFRQQSHIECLVKGLMFLRRVQTEQSFYSLKSPFSFFESNKIRPEMCTPDKKLYRKFEEDQQDFLLIDVGRTVNFYQVSQEGQFKRLSESIIGETTFSTLIKLLTNYENMYEVLDGGMKGYSDSVDLTVGDLYGGSSPELLIPASTVASTLGKVQYLEDKEKISSQDFARSMMSMFCCNIAQLANLLLDVTGIKTAVFQGFSHVGFQTILMAMFGPRMQQRDVLFVDNVEHISCLGMHLSLKESSENCQETKNAA